MAKLVSPGVDVQIIAEDFYIPVDASAVPLIFIATADEKMQADGITPAVGTFESGVLRTVTSLKQAIELYGVPKFYTSASGQAHHGDARNEYGLDALCKFLEVGNRAYVVRANVNLNDNLADLKSMWADKTADAAEYLNTLVTDWIAQYNALNNLVPVDAGYKRSVTKAVAKTLINEALSDVFAKSSFSKDAFANAFLNDHTTPQAGYQDVVFESFSGFITETDITGLLPETNYSATVEVVTGTGTVTREFAFSGDDAITFGDLVEAMNTVLGAAGTASLVQGRLRITSSLTGATSAVSILGQGSSALDQPLFSSLKFFDYIADEVAGTGAQTLSVFNDSFTTLTGSYDGLYGLVEDWSAGTTVATEFTGEEAEGLLLSAAAQFDNTKQFKDLTALGANDATRRAAIVKQLQAVINSPTTNVRSESLEYDLVIAPGYYEVSDELVRLCQDMQEEVFVIGETPFDKSPTGPNSLAVWATTTAKVSSEHIAYYYAHGISSNIDGSDIMSSAATTALRTIAYSDSVSEGPHIAPAGVTRGVCPHLTDIGYVSGTLGGPTTFVSELLDNGTRDELYEAPRAINPITFIPGRGILVLGQKTTSPVASSLDRVNVSRLVKRIKRQLRKALFSYGFEPNDAITWKNVKATTDNYLTSLISRRALYDFASVCDGTNNDEGIDAQELYVDVVVKPVKAVEFVYARVRLARRNANIGTNRK